MEYGVEFFCLLNSRETQVSRTGEASMFWADGTLSSMFVESKDGHIWIESVLVAIGLLRESQASYV